MAETDETSISLSRTIDAPVEEVFAAWIDPALIEQWQADHADFEAFEGGSFRFETADMDDPRVSHVVSGTVTGFEENSRLIELWHPQDGEPEDASTLIVTFEALDPERTRLSITEIATAHADPQSRIFSMEAWDAALAELAELLE